MRRYHQRIEAIRTRYKLELTKKRLWHLDLVRRHEADTPSPSRNALSVRLGVEREDNRDPMYTDEEWAILFANYPDQLLIRIYGKAVRKLRGLEPSE